MEASDVKQNEKDVIFISHATPEDDELAIWLATKLQMAGYKVWIDKNELKGGEEFWDNIQNILNNNTVKFLCILSNVAVNKKGVKDEIHYALNIENTQHLTDFVLPILKEDINQMPINLLRKNYIGEFKNNWGEGLKRIIGFLEKHDVIKTNNYNVNDIEMFLHKQVIKLEKGSETIMSNQFKIKSLPRFLYFYNSGPQKLKTSEYYGYPIREFSGRFVTFYSPEEIQTIIPECSLQLETKIELREFINNGINKYSSNTSHDDIDKIIKSLISKTFDLILERKKLKNMKWKHSSDWWIPNNLIKDNKVYFTNYKNDNTHRILVGTSKQYLWHFGFRYKIRNRNGEYYVEISPRTIYTDTKDFMVKIMIQIIPSYLLEKQKICLK